MPCIQTLPEGCLDIIGDIHGQYAALQALLRHLGYDEDGTQRLYLVRETKDTRNLDDLGWDEAMRIRFAERHFDAAPRGVVDYNFTTDKRGVLVGESEG